MSRVPPSSPQTTDETRAARQARAEREAASLRANLLKRKAQRRAREGYSATVEPGQRGGGDGVVVQVEPDHGG
uniref:Uncharacterized protein n=1 Tax=Acidicaldus sp. TaxID=1872105 RepID=A0A8J4M704_9PROT